MMTVFEVSQRGRPDFMSSSRTPAKTFEVAAGDETGF
jgi:hypothetical protein